MPRIPWTGRCAGGPGRPEIGVDVPHHDKPLDVLTPKTQAPAEIEQGGAHRTGIADAHHVVLDVLVECRPNGVMRRKVDPIADEVVVVSMDGEEFICGADHKIDELPRREVGE